MLKDKLSSASARIKQNLPELAFLLFSIRLIILGSSIGDSLALVSIAGILGYKWFLAKDKHDALAGIKQDIEDMKTHMQALKMDKIIKQRSVSDEPKKEKRYF
jgi:hypothetical protein